MKKQIFMTILFSVFLSAEIFSVDCNLPYYMNDYLFCECCSENWGGGDPPELAYVVFQGIERTNYDPNWVLLPAPNNRLFVLRLTEELTGNTCAWSYNLDAVGGEGGPESNVWVIHFDLTTRLNNVYLANKVDDYPFDMIYFCHTGYKPPCRTIYTTNEIRQPYFWAGGTARIFWSVDFNSDGIVNFEDFSILNSIFADPNAADPNIQGFTKNWLNEF